MASTIALPRRFDWLHRARGPEFAWALAFLLPYAAVLLAFAVYPIVTGLWLAHQPSLYAELLADPFYLRTVANTALFVGFAVNLKMVLAFLLSGFFMRRRWWTNALLAVYILPWALSAIPSFLSIHWMLIGGYGLVDRLLWVLFGLEGPIWFNETWLALAMNVAAYIWKWMPFWTMIFLAGRIAIPREFYEAAEVDGAGGPRRFLHVTVPLLANLYIVCTLLSTLWAAGDFTTVHFVSGGGPALSTEVLATIGMHYAFDFAKPELGVAAAMSALPILIALAILLLRRVQATELQL